MELREAIRGRVSVRHFLPDPVAIDDLEEIVQMGGQAPSINNSQPWRFIAIVNKELLQDMAEAVSQALTDVPMTEDESASQVRSQVEWFSTFFKDAPAVIALSVKPYATVLERGALLSHEEINRIRNYPDVQSIGACMQNMLLTAVDLGYGACWLSAPLVAKERLEPMLGIEYPWQLVSFVALGRARGQTEAKPRKNLEEIFRLID